MPDQAPSKDELRATLRGIVAGLDPSLRGQRSASLAQRLHDDERWAAAINVAAFIGVGHEPETMDLLRAALADGKRIWLPRVLDAAAGKSELVQIDDPAALDALVPGVFGLREPAPDAGPCEPAIVPSMELDVVLVPGLGFDREGGRLGHGPGHYDRLLAPVADIDRPWRIGVCFAEQLDAFGEDALPMEDHDVPMHLVVTDELLVTCGPREEVPHVVEPAASGRAKCRACGDKIAKGTLRFGEKVDNPYGDGLATYWFHLVCGALRRPEPFEAMLRANPMLSFDEREVVLHRAQRGLSHPRLARLTTVMRDPSGRARCRHCRETIAKGDWRVALSIWQEARFEPIGFIHLTCAPGYFETSDPDDLLPRIEAMSPKLSGDDMNEIAAVLSPTTAAGTDS